MSIVALSAGLGREMCPPTGKVLFHPYIRVCAIC